MPFLAAAFFGLAFLSDPSLPTASMLRRATSSASCQSAPPSTPDFAALLRSSAADSGERFRLLRIAQRCGRSDEGRGDDFGRHRVLRDLLRALHDLPDLGLAGDLRLAASWCPASWRRLFVAAAGLAFAADFALLRRCLRHRALPWFIANTPYRHTAVMSLCFSSATSIARAASCSSHARQASRPRGNHGFFVTAIVGNRRPGRTRRPAARCARSSATSTAS